MKTAALDLIGKKDFKNFCNKGSTVKKTVLELLQIDWKIYQEQDATKVHIFFQGNGFLKQMIRNIVGTLVDIGLKKKELGIFKEVLKENGTRSMLGKTAPAQALFLEKIRLRVGDIDKKLENQLL